jgi:hypothetical protein
MGNGKLRILAILLLLVFIQRPVVQVLLHNKHHSQGKQAIKGNGATCYQVRCDCLDEALVPLNYSECFELHAPSGNYNVLHTSYRVHLSFAAKLYRSLRAPPFA